MSQKNKLNLNHQIKSNMSEQVNHPEHYGGEENPYEENVKNCIIINNFIMKLYNKIK